MPEEAKKKLSDVPGNEAFVTNCGKELKNLGELLYSLNNMTDEAFSHHVNDEKNDFSSWVRNSVKDEVLANDLDKVRTLEDTKIILNKRIADLEKRVHVGKIIEKINSLNSSVRKKVIDDDKSGFLKSLEDENKISEDNNAPAPAPAPEVKMDNTPAPSNNVDSSDDLVVPDNQSGAQADNPIMPGSADSIASESSTPAAPEMPAMPAAAPAPAPAAPEPASNEGMTMPAPIENTGSVESSASLGSLDDGDALVSPVAPAAASAPQVSAPEVATAPVAEPVPAAAPEPVSVSAPEVAPAASVSNDSDDLMVPSGTSGDSAPGLMPAAMDSAPAPAPAAPAVAPAAMPAAMDSAPAPVPAAPVAPTQETAPGMPAPVSAPVASENPTSISDMNLDDMPAASAPVSPNNTLVDTPPATATEQMSTSSALDSLSVPEPIAAPEPAMDVPPAAPTPVSAPNVDSSVPPAPVTAPNVAPEVAPAADVPPVPPVAPTSSAPAPVSTSEDVSMDDLYSAALNKEELEHYSKDENIGGSLSHVGSLDAGSHGDVPPPPKPGEVNELSRNALLNDPLKQNSMFNNMNLSNDISKPSMETAQAKPTVVPLDVKSAGKKKGFFSRMFGR